MTSHRLLPDPTSISYHILRFGIIWLLDTVLKLKKQNNPKIYPNIKKIKKYIYTCFRYTETFKGEKQSSSGNNII